MFGSSQIRSGSKLRFSESTYSDDPNNEDTENDFAASYASSNFPLPRTRNGTPAKPFGARSTLGGPQSSMFGHSNFGGSRSGHLGRSGLHQELHFDDDDDVANGEMDMDPKSSNPQPAAGTPKWSIYRNPQSAKRAKIDEKWAHQKPSPKGPHPPPRNKPSPIPSIARDIAARSSTAPVLEPSSLILDSEDVFCSLYDQARDLERGSEDVEHVLSGVCEDLINVWAGHAQDGPVPQGTRNNGTISLEEASALGSLLLQLHHPPLLKSKPHPGAMRPSASRAMVLASQNDQQQTPIPKILLDWISLHRTPKEKLNTVQTASPNITASPQFWDTIQALTLRGNFTEVIQLFKSADFKYARSALEDGQVQPGYHGAQLQNIQKSVNRAVQILSSSPQLQSDDWDVKGLDWAMFRKKVATTVSELEEFAEGQDREPEVEEDRFHASNFNMPAQAKPFSFSQSSRMAESRVPWTIYQNLKAMYHIILGEDSAILAHSQDWIEATIALTVWWNGDDDDEVTQDSLNARRSQTRLSQSQSPRSVDSNPGEAYLRRLDYIFSCVTNIEDVGAFKVNSLNNFEVGVASLFENNVEGVVDLLKTWSLAIASAVVEVASLGSWLETSAGARPLSGLNENDLMVLSYGQEERRVHKDEIMISYASGLCEREILENSSGIREGWEIALEILSRLDDRDTMLKRVNSLLDGIPLDTPGRMDKVVLLCTELGFDDESRKVSEVRFILHDPFRPV